MDQPVTLRELLARYVAENLIDANWRTVQKHRIAIGHLERTLGREPLVADLSNATVARMMHDLSAKGLTPAGVNGYRAKLVALWTWACKMDWLAVWPTTRKLKEPKRTPVAWSEREIRILWAALDRQPGYIGGVPAASWWKAYHLIAWNTGERHSARMALRWDHFTDLDRGVGVFPAEIRKGKSADLPFALHPFTVALLRELLPLGHDVVHPWPFEPDAFWVFYTALLQSAGLKHDRSHKTHCLRRSFATHLVAGGFGRADAGQALGHLDAGTIRHYIDESMVPKRLPYEILFKPWEVPPGDPPRAA